MIEIINNKIKKTFDYKDEDNQTFLKNEVFWLNYLKGKWVPELLEVGNNYVVTRYYGRDLIQQKYKPDRQQVIDMFKLFRTDKYKDFEVMSYNKWISKIDSDLVEELKCMI